MKKFLAVLLMSSFLFQAQARAGVIIVLGGAYLANNHADNLDRRLKNTFVIGGVVGFVAVMGVGVTLTALQFVPASMPFFILGEETLSSDNLEHALMEKYPSISDREALRGLAEEMVKIQEKQEYDVKGTKFVQISEDKIRAIFAPTDISEAEVNQVVEDLQ